ncbi:MAG: hypothetical protein UDG94_11295 [Peptococcaceae bacterium]|nr:hypothetical protein [Peptococcaceae bacterium]
MSKLKTIATVAALTAGAAGAVVAVKKMKSAYHLELENCTTETLNIYLGTAAAPDAIVFENFLPGEKRYIDLTLLPLAEHDVVYIRFPDTVDHAGYKRTLIYDIEECHSPMHGMIVDYGDNNYDVKLVRVG